MKIKELRRQLKIKNAKWTIPDDVLDDISLKELSQKYSLGAKTEIPGMLKTRLPRFRGGSTKKFLKWQPHTLRQLRSTLSRQPSTWDWRDVNNQNWVSPVKDQGGCGSCVAFAVLAAFESHYRLLKNNPHLNMDLSEGALFFSNERQCNSGDPRVGWWVNKGLDSIVEDGVCSELVYPYRATNQNVELSQGTYETFKAAGYDSTTNTSLMKKWLVEEGPLVTRFDVYDDFFAFWRGGANGVYTYTGTPYAGGHAVAVVGYDDNDKCWICKNSWGSLNNQENGCFRIGYGEVGIDERMYLIQDVHNVITRDEINYNPRNLRIRYEGDKGWLLTDGVSRMKMLDNKEDARNALRVARRHTRHGFIGRDNNRSNRSDYIIEYWAGNSGLPHEPLTKVDAISYDPRKIVAEDLDNKGWRLKEGNHWMEMADDFNDALTLLQIAERHNKMCFIGRGNNRANRKSYIMTYWE